MMLLLIYITYIYFKGLLPNYEKKEKLTTWFYQLNVTLEYVLEEYCKI